jgi:hypothetical protein
MLSHPVFREFQKSCNEHSTTLFVQVIHVFMSALLHYSYGLFDFKYVFSHTLTTKN